VDKATPPPQTEVRRGVICSPVKVTGLRSPQYPNLQSLTIQSICSCPASCVTAQVPHASVQSLKTFLSGKERDFSLLQIFQTGSGAHQASYSTGTRSSCPRKRVCKAAGVKQGPLPQYGAEIRSGVMCLWCPLNGGVGVGPRASL